MQKQLLVSLYKKRNSSDATILDAIHSVQTLEKHASKTNESLDTISLNVLKSHISDLINTDENSPAHLIALARYYYAIDNKPIYIYFAALFGSLGVIPNICNRIHTSYPNMPSFEAPPLGLDPKEMPIYTKSFMELLNNTLTEKEYTKLMAGNNHDVPRDAILPEKNFYKQALSLDVYLKERHQRKIDELTRHMKEDKLWFEQIITQEVIDYVASSQEILSAVKDGNYLYVTKIPFDTKAFLESTTKQDQLYHVCHCPFVREGLREGRQDINPNWCYCSAGFAKFPFEIMFNRELSVELLETPLKGDLRCRFRIKLDMDIINTDLA